MRIAIDQARLLLETVMHKLGHSPQESVIIADHLMDSELRGLRQGGLARAISISERIAKHATPRTPMRIEHETGVSARIDGGDNVGYLVGR